MEGRGKVAKRDYMETQNKIFKYQFMQFEEADSLATGLHDRQIEISLIDTTVLPGGVKQNKNNRCVMTEKYLEYAERIHNFTVREDDVWVITFPKCGTTWTQEMVWMIDHDLDYKTALTRNVLDRSVFLEMSAVAGDKIPGDSVDIIDKLQGRRHIKTHLPLAMLPKQLWSVKPKMVYCTRNALDVAVSYMHHYRHLHGFKGSNDTFLKGLLEDKVLWCPQVQHTLDFYKYKVNFGQAGLHDLDHFMFLHYEEMKKDLMSVLKRTCKFLKKTYTDEQLMELSKHLSFEAMKANPCTNNSALISKLAEIHNEGPKFQFMRKGKVGTYKDELEPEYIQRFQAHINEQLKGTSFKYIYDI